MLGNDKRIWLISLADVKINDNYLKWIVNRKEYV